MFRFSCRVGGVSALVSQLSLSHCSATANTSSDSTPSISNSKSTNNDKEFVAVFFTKQSKEFMKAQLEQLGVKDATVSYACINSNSKPEDSYVFKPLFGDRAAFRLKGNTIAHSNRYNLTVLIIVSATNILLYLKSSATVR